MSKRWIDLTDLVHWQGHMTGIQRVVYSFAKEFADNKQASFFVFDPKDGFKEVEFTILANRNQSTETPMTFSVREQRAQRVRKALTRRAAKYSKMTARYVFNRVPTEVQHKIIRVYSTYKNKDLNNQILTLGIDLFNDNDTVMLLGASWYNASIIVNLGRIKMLHNIKISHMVYDMIPEISPHYFGQGFGDVYIKHMFNVFSVSNELLAISKNTKKDIVAFQKKMLLPEVPISVVRLGDSPTTKSGSTSPDARISKNDYILAVGTLEIRKNYLALYYIWKKAHIDGTKLPKLVIVGRAGWLSSDSMYLMQSDPDVKDQIIILDNASDPQLAWLYLNCKFTIYPSWYEGWGLPIAESLNYGKVCITSSTSSMTEIAGDILPYFDPFNPSKALDLIKAYLASPELLVATEDRIRREYKSVSWTVGYKACLRSFARLEK